MASDSDLVNLAGTMIIAGTAVRIAEIGFGRTRPRRKRKRKTRR